MAGGFKILASNLRRVVRIGRVLAAHALAQMLGPRLACWPWLARRLPSGALSGPQRLAAALEDLGGTFIKFGQMLALQPDILPLAYCNALFDLMDRVAPFPWDEARRVFLAETGRLPDEAFDRCERRPIATASIGQVHVAWKDGCKLAVKVQRPAVEADFHGDIRLMTTMVALIRRLRLARLYWLLEPISEFVIWTREELDYRNEARYMEQLRRNAADNPREKVPATAAALCTRRVLTAEFLEGITVLDYLRAAARGDEVLPARLRAWGFDANLFARHMIDNFLGDAFRHGLFHADLHPANLMIFPDNVVGYVDFGITGVLSRYSRRNLVALTLAYSNGDLDGMSAAFQRLAEPGERFDRGAFRAGLELLGEEWYEGRERRLRKNFTLMMLDMLRLSRQTDIWPEREVIKYIRSSIAVDGLITRFAPLFDLGAYLAEACERYLRLEAQQELLSYHNLIAGSLAGGRLLRDGAARIAEILDRIAAGDLGLATELEGKRVDRRDGGRQGDWEGEALGARALRGAAVVLAAAVAIAAAGEPTHWGFNLFTAAAVIGTAALARMGRAAWDLARAAPRRLAED
jgi:ubiquinone biosynthesis protein